jgi:hypothetical protein
MNKIEPHYVDFNTAKLLKEKGFNVECRNYYLEKDKALHEGFEDEYWGDYRCINWNADVIGIKPFQGFVSAPEQWQIVEWLRVKHGIWISVYTMDKWLSNDNDRVQIFDYSIKQMKRGLIDISKKLEEFDSPKEAYSAAFDYILNNLI